jgi:endonuclease YncB( thermonuclease family)
MWMFGAWCLLTVIRYRLSVIRAEESRAKGRGARAEEKLKAESSKHLRNKLKAESSKLKVFRKQAQSWSELCVI